MSLVLSALMIIVRFSCD